MIDLNCPIVIPQDMLLNQIIERYRGDHRHGSCGLGYNESIIRNNIERYKITCNDIINKTYKDKLELIKNEYIKERLAQLNLTIKFVDDICMKINPYICYLSHVSTRSTIIEQKNTINKVMLNNPKAMF